MTQDRYRSAAFDRRFARRTKFRDTSATSFHGRLSIMARRLTDRSREYDFPVRRTPRSTFVAGLVGDNTFQNAIAVIGAFALPTATMMGARPPCRRRHAPCCDVHGVDAHVAGFNNTMLALLGAEITSGRRVRDIPAPTCPAHTSAAHPMALAT